MLCKVWKIVFKSHFLVTYFGTKGGTCISVSDFFLSPCSGLVISNPPQRGRSSSIKISNSFYAEEVSHIWGFVMLHGPPSPDLFAFALSSTSDFYHGITRSKKQEVFKRDMGVHRQLAAL